MVAAAAAAAVLAAVMIAMLVFVMVAVHVWVECQLTGDQSVYSVVSAALHAAKELDTGLSKRRAALTTL